LASGVVAGPGPRRVGRLGRGRARAGRVTAVALLEIEKLTVEFPTLSGPF
jgi:hypothetical protein